MATKAQLIRNAHTRKVETEKLYEAVKGFDCKLEKITDYHFRLGNLLDIFPTKKRLFHLHSKRWGHYTDIHDLVELNFPKKSEDSIDLAWWLVLGFTIFALTVSIIMKS